MANRLISLLGNLLYKTPLLTVLCFLFLFPVPSMGDEPVESQNPALFSEPYLQIQTTTTSRMEEPVQDSSGSISVMTQEEIETQNPSTAPEVLRDMTGVRLQESGTMGESAVLSLRGSETSQTLIMIEGVRVNEPFRGRLDIGNFFMDEIGQIEMVRGAQSALYGSDAIGGVVHLRVKRPKKPFEISMMGELGTEHLYRTFLSVGGIRPWVEYSLTLSGVQTEGQFENDLYRAGNVSGFIMVPVKTSGQFKYIYRFQDDHKGLGVDLVPIPPTTSSAAVQAFFDENSNLDRRFLFQSIQFQDKIAQWLGISWRASFIETEFDWDNPPDPINSMAYFEDTDTRTLILDFQQDIIVTPYDTFTFGVEWRKESVDTDISFLNTPLSLHDNRWNTGYYVQNLLKWEKQFIFQGGVRIDENSDFTTMANPKFSGAYVIDATKTKVRGGWGKGFSGPTFQRILLREFQNLPGNPKLNPEKAVSWEVGFQQPFLSDRILFDAVFFRIDYKNLIQPSPIGVDNIGRARTQGIEILLKIRPVETFSLNTSFTYLDSEDKNSDEELPFRPSKQWNINLIYSPIVYLIFNMDIHIISSQALTPGTDFTLVDGTVLKGRSPGYTRVDFTGTYYIFGGFHWVRESRVFIKIRNLFDKDYDSVPGFPSPGFGASGGVVFYF